MSPQGRFTTCSCALSRNLIVGLQQTGECNCQRRSKIGPKGGVKLVHFL